MDDCCSAMRFSSGYETVLIERCKRMPPPKLSICIPTFMRRERLLATATVVCEQLPAGAEVVISDNGSTDGTSDAVRAFSAARPDVPIRLVTHAVNVGFDRNVLDVVSNAQGDYCWLLGDDDVPREGAVARIISELDHHPDLIHLLVNHARFDVSRNAITKARMVAMVDDVDPATASEFFFRHCPPPSYFRRLGTNVITLSANVVHRGRWLEAAAGAEQFIGSNMIHVFVIAAMLSRQGRTRFIATPLYDYACNNHRPWSSDVWHDYHTRVYGWLRQLGYDPVQLSLVEAEEVTHRTWRDFARAIRDRVLRRRQRAGA